VTDPCICMECRVRQAIIGKPTTDLSEVDTTEALNALGNVVAELLAHHSSKAAKRYAAQLLDARKRWQAEPRVAIQNPPAGHA
jgi:hypothetical protein